MNNEIKTDKSRLLELISEGLEVKDKIQDLMFEIQHPVIYHEMKRRGIRIYHVIDEMEEKGLLTTPGHTFGALAIEYMYSNYVIQGPVEKGYLIHLVKK